MGYKEELAALIESTEKGKGKPPHKKEKKRVLFSFSIKKIFLAACVICGIVFSFLYFFNGKSEEDLIREQFTGIAELLNKNKKEGVIVAAANMQKLGSYFCPVTHIEIEGLPWINGDLDRETVIRHAFRGKSMFDRLRIDFAVYEFGIHGNNATVLFTVTLSGTLKSGDKLTEARELEAVLNKDSGKWLFQSCRINELIRK